MFSETYSLREKYNLNTQEHVSTCESMPVRFTRLADDRYGPELPESVKDKLNLYFDYKPQHVKDPIRDDDNDMFIEYKDGQLLSFFSKKFLRLSNITTVDSPNLWNGFLNYIQCPEINDCWYRVQELTEGIHVGQIAFNGIEYNADGSFSGIRIFTEKFNTRKYTDNLPGDMVSVLDRIEILGNWYTKDPWQKLGDTSITFYPDGNIKYTLNFDFPWKLNTSYKGKKVNRLEHMNNSYVDNYLKILSIEGGPELLTEDEVTFIRSLCVNEAFFSLSFNINLPDETCTDKFVYIHKIAEFEDLTAG